MRRRYIILASITALALAVALASNQAFGERQTPYIKPVDGPALPVNFLGDCVLKSITVEKSWCNGCYSSVNFSYISQTSYEDFLKKHLQDVPEKDVVVRTRQSGVIHQSITICRDRVVKKPKAKALIQIEEVLMDSSPQPSRWYSKAISPKPPVKLASVPFLKGVKAEAVGFGNLKYLTTPIGTIPPKDTDTIIYSAWVPDYCDTVIKNAQRWLTKNGFKKTESGSYYKQQVGCFEIMIYGDRGRTRITWYVSNRLPKRSLVTYRK